MATNAPASRIDWVDVAKGLCIILVVMFHSTLGVEKAIGETTLLNDFVEWARPFRMPDFFLISGLFLAARIDRPWRSYLDTKVLHFAYFYVLWLHILLAVKAPSIIAETGASGFLATYVTSFVDPFSSLWFIYLLAVYFVVAKLLLPLPKGAVLAGAAILHTFWPETGTFLADEFASRFVFFYAGYAAAPWIMQYAGRVAGQPILAVQMVLAVWAVTNAAIVGAGWSHVPVVDLAVSAMGIGAVIALSVLLAGSAWGEPIRYCGRNSISIYLAFTLFMGPVRQATLKLVPGLPGEAVTLLAMSAGILGALALAWAVKGTRLGFLFERPDWLRLSPARRLAPRYVPARKSFGQRTRAV